jgi:hypothetical protein
LQLKQLLILLFALVALIPASLLTANSAYSVFKLQEQISNLYHGILVIIVGLDDGHLSLLQMKSNILSHILTNDRGQMQSLEERIKQNERRFSDVLANYKEISDFPLQVEIMKRRGLEHMISDDHAFITQVRVDWIQYQATRDSLLSLSAQNRNSEAAALAFGEANAKFDRLIASYQKTVDLNKEIARVLYEESNYVSGLAYLNSAVVFALSFGIAVVVAVMLSKKMTSPIAEAQRRAKKNMDKFAVENSIMERSHHPTFNSRSHLENNIKEEEVVGSASDNASTFTTPEPVEMGITADERQLVNETLSNNQLILLHAESYNKNNKETPPSLSSKFLRFLVSSNDDRGGSYVVNSGPTTTNKKLVLITRAGSNLHQEIQHRGNAEIYLLSMSTLAPITKSAEGLVVISLTQTALIVEAVRRTLEKNPLSTVIFDNLTQLVNTIGFEKTYALIHTLFDVVPPYPNARIVFLVNKNAHKPHEIQSIANMFNVFVQQ